MHGNNGGSLYHEALLDKRKDVLTGLGLQVNELAQAIRASDEDQAQMSHDEFLNMRLNKIEWDTLRLIDEALDRLQTGDYGTCMRCEEPISPKRLKALPWAKYCVRCQEKLSKRDQEGTRDEAPDLVWSS